MALSALLHHYSRPACVAGTLLLHWGAALALPEAALPTGPAPRPTLVWLEASPGSAGAAGPEGEARSASAVAAPATHQAQAPRLRGAARQSPPVEQPRRSLEAPEHIAAPPAEAEGPALASAGTLVPVRAGGGGGAMGGSLTAGGGRSGGGRGAGLGGGAAHGPGLLVAGRPCAGYFPAQAHVDSGEVQISVDVDSAGHARASSVLVEFPHGEGFGPAARACAQRLHFAPAIDVAGAPVAGRTRLKLRFTRA